MNLPTNTTDRLHAVADLIEFHPERWDQGMWVDDRRDLRPQQVAGEPECHTTGCVAGWAVMLTPVAEVDESVGRRCTFCHEQECYGESWQEAGAASLGIDQSLAGPLFVPSLDFDEHELADLLRRLAKLPEDERTIRKAWTVATGEQMQVLDPFEIYKPESETP